MADFKPSTKHLGVTNGHCFADDTFTLPVVPCSMQTQTHASFISNLDANAFHDTVMFRIDVAGGLDALKFLDQQVRHEKAVEPVIGHVARSLNRKHLECLEIKIAGTKVN